MSKRYPGNFITGNPVALSQTSNNGVYDLKDEYTAVSNGAWGEADGIYEISKSLRFRRSANAYLTSTPRNAGNRTTWTWSGWLKFGAPSQSSDFGIFHAGSSDTNRAALYWDAASQKFNWGYRNSSSWVYYFNTLASFRDPTAWYHVVLAFDTGNAVTSERNRLYVNGVRQAVAETGTAAQNATSQINNTDTHSVGANYYFSSTTSMDGYMSEVNFVDGLALDPSYFGYFDPLTNIWQPKGYTGSYGTNGFYLPFKDTTDLNSLCRNEAKPNWFSYSQEIDNAFWNKAYGIGGVTANAIIAPDGTQTADFVYETSGTDQRHFRSGGGTSSTYYVANQWFTLSIYAKSAGNGRDYVQLYADTNQGDAVYNPTFNLANGTVTATPTVAGSATAGTSTITSVGNGWYRLTMSGKITQSGNMRVGYYFSNVANTGNASYAGGGSSYGMYFWGACINGGSVAVPYVGNPGAVTTYTDNTDYVPTNISLTSGVTYDSMADSPVNVFTSLPIIATTVTPVSYTDTGVSTASIAVAFPSSGIIVGDLLVMTLGSKNATGATWSTPSGWTYATADDSSSENSAVYWKIADGTENGGTVTVTESSGTNAKTGYITVFRNAVFGDISTFTTVSSGTSVTSIAVPTTAPNTISVIWAKSDQGNATTWSASNSFTKVKERLTEGGTALFTKTISSVGSGETSVISFGVNPAAVPVTLVAFTIKPANTQADTGGIVPGNYCTWNPLVAANYTNVNAMGSTTISFTDGNLSNSNPTNGGFAPRMQCWGTIGMTTGKWYAEFTNMSNMNCGVSKGPIITGSGNGIDCYAHYSASGAFNVGNNATGTSTGTALSATTSDIIGLAFDVDNGIINWYKNGTLMGGFTSLNGSASIHGATAPWFFGRSPDSSGSGATITANFGQRPFAYTPPVGYKSLNTTNLQALGTSTVGNAAIQANKWFDVSLYSGIGNTQQVKNSGKFQPDLVWTKARNASNYNNILVDSARGAGVILASDITNVESSGQNYWITGFDSDGFTLGSAGANGTNASGISYVGWQWKQSPVAGLNIISYTGTGVNNRAISHNLGVAPSFIIVKSRDIAYNWDIYHSALGTATTLTFTSDAQRNYSAFGTTAPTSSNFYTQDNYTNTNASKYIAYVWTDIPGFSRFGTYVGNGSTDGPFVHTGFKPRYIIWKNVSSNSKEWIIQDAARQPYNNAPSNAYNLAANGSYGENDASMLAGPSNANNIDFLSNGFKIRYSNANCNYVGEKYVYAVFAENPFALNNRAR